MNSQTNITVPNFFIVGAAKAGTTSLYEYLSQHSDVYFSSIKEPHYFDTDTIDHDFDYEADYIDFDSAIKKKLHSLRKWECPYPQDSFWASC